MLLLLVAVFATVEALFAPDALAEFSTAVEENRAGGVSILVFAADCQKSLSAARFDTCCAVFRSLPSIKAAAAAEAGADNVRKLTRLAENMVWTARNNGREEDKGSAKLSELCESQRKVMMRWIYFLWTSWNCKGCTDCSLDTDGPI